MNYCGDFAPGQEVYIWFNTFDSNDPSASVTMTTFIDTDVHIHKDDSLTQRNNAAGVEVDVDVDGIAGVHKITIHTDDNTVADFWEAGHDYAVRIEGATVDAALINPVVGTFSIANRRVAGEMCRSSIESLASQTSFTLTSGEASAQDDAYNNCMIIVTDQTTRIQKALAYISDYTGATRTITLIAAPLATGFTMAVGDSVEILATAAFANVGSWNSVPLATTNPLPNAASDAAGGLPISDAGGLDLDALDTAAVRLTAARAQAIDDWINGGRLDLILDAILDDTDLIDDGTSGLAKIATDVAAILVDSAVIGALGAGLTGIPWNAAWDAEVQSEVVDALTAEGFTSTRGAYLDELAAANLPADIDAILNDTDVIDDATSGLVKIAQDVAAILVDTAVIGALGAGLTGVPWNAAWDAEVQSEVVDALTAEGYSSTRAAYLDELAAANLPTDVDAILTDTGTTLSATLASLVAAVITNATGADVATDVVALTASLLLHNVQKNVALSDFPVVMYLSSDHVTPATGKTVTVQRSLDGAALAGAGGTMTESSLGLYHFDAAQADTNGNMVTWRFTAAACDDVWFSFKTVT